jgi:hypothetical protein
MRKERKEKSHHENNRFRSTIYSGFFNKNLSPSSPKKAFGENAQIKRNQKYGDGLKLETISAFFLDRKEKILDPFVASWC